MTKIFVCPGPRDGTETCAFWSMDSGMCPYHPKIELKPKDLGNQTIREFIRENEED